MAPQKSGGGYAGLVVAAIGIAAAAGLFFFLRSEDQARKAAQTTAVQTTTVEATAAPAPTEQPDPGATAEEASQAPRADDADDGSVDIDELTDAADSATPGPTALALGPGPTPSGAPTAATTSEPKNKDPKDPVAAADDDQLSDAMRKAAGDPTKSENPQPASDATGPKNLPDKPPQGSVSAYVGSVMGAAKGCVAGADDKSSATVTFGSNGAVQSVSVGGWAAGKAAASCIQSALKGGRVEAFSKPSYSFSVTIRP